MKKFDKQKAIDGYKLSLSMGMNFLMEQLELYKEQFAESGDNKYLKTMNDMYSCYKLVVNMDYEIKRLSKECRRLTKENTELKK